MSQMSCALTEEQIYEFREAFCSIDKDSDGTCSITIEEVKAVLQSLTEHAKKEEAQDLIDEVDAQGLVTINFKEYLSIIERKMQEQENVAEEIKEAFKVFDRDQDGYISSTELRHVMMSMGERLTEEEAQQMISEADLDGDGLVSYEEFVKMMMSTELNLINVC